MIQAIPLFLGLLLAAPPPQDTTLRGKVVDGSGQPVEGATIATLWTEKGPFGGAKTDAAGEWVLEASTYGRTTAVLVMDAEKKTGAISVYSPSSFGEERTLKMVRLARVEGKIVSSELGEQPPWTNAYAYLMPEGLRVGRFSSREAKVSFRLPPGDYKFNLYGTDIGKTDILRTIEPGTKAVDLGTVDIPATEIAKLYGKAPPRWNVTDARGVDEKAQLGDFKGKYILVDFWGYW